MSLTARDKLETTFPSLDLGSAISFVIHSIERTCSSPFRLVDLPPCPHTSPHPIEISPPSVPQLQYYHRLHFFSFSCFFFPMVVLPHRETFTFITGCPHNTLKTHWGGGTSLPKLVLGRPKPTCLCFLLLRRIHTTDRLTENLAPNPRCQPRSRNFFSL